MALHLVPHHVHKFVESVIVAILYNCHHLALLCDPIEIDITGFKVSCILIFRIGTKIHKELA